MIACAKSDLEKHLYYNEHVRKHPIVFIKSVFARWQNFREFITEKILLQFLFVFRNHQTERQSWRSEKL